MDEFKREQDLVKLQVIGFKEDAKDFSGDAKGLWNKCKAYFEIHKAMFIVAGGCLVLGFVLGLLC